MIGRLTGPEAQAAALHLAKRGEDGSRGPRFKAALEAADLIYAAVPKATAGRERLVIVGAILDLLKVVDDAHAAALYEARKNERTSIAIEIEGAIRAVLARNPTR